MREEEEREIQEREKNQENMWPTWLGYIGKKKLGQGKGSSWAGEVYSEGQE